MLPKTFNAAGVLPQDYEVTLEEIRQSLLVNGPEPIKPNWDVNWRRNLVDNAEVLVRQLWDAGITTVYLNGSFVQSIGHPGDIDGCFECDYEEWASGALADRLNKAAPKKVWGWAETDFRLVLGKPRLAMWASYKVELYPYCPGRSMGLRNDNGEFIKFPDAYRWTKDGSPKGILKLKPTI